MVGLPADESDAIMGLGVFPHQSEVVKHQAQPPLVVLLAQCSDVTPQGVRRLIVDSSSGHRSFHLR